MATRRRLVWLSLSALPVAVLLGCVAGSLFVTRLWFWPAAGVRSLSPVASLACQKYPGSGGGRGSYCAWYMGANTILVIPGEPEQVIASYAPRHLVIRAGPIQFAIGAVTTEDESPQVPPLFPVYFGFSLFLEGLP